MDKKFHPTLSWACDYSSMLGLKSTHVSKRGPWDKPILALPDGHRPYHCFIDSDCNFPNIKLASSIIKKNMRENYGYKWPAIHRKVRCHGITLKFKHHSDVTISAMASQITCVSIVCSTVCLGADKSVSLRCESSSNWYIWIVIFLDKIVLDPFFKLNIYHTYKVGQPQHIIEFKNPLKLRDPQPVDMCRDHKNNQQINKSQ